MLKSPLIKLFNLLLLLAILTGCNANVAVPTAATTPVPLSERDLSTVVLQASDIPKEYSVRSEEQLDGVFPNAEGVHDKVVNSNVALLKTADSRHVYSSGVIVYENEEQAIKAYQSILKTIEGKDQFKPPEIGDEAYGMIDVIDHPAIKNDIYLTMILWRVKDSLLYLSNADSDQEPSQANLRELAQKIHARAIQ